MSTRIGVFRHRITIYVEIYRSKGLTSLLHSRRSCGLYAHHLGKRIEAIRNRHEMKKREGWDNCQIPIEIEENRRS